MLEKEEIKGNLPFMQKAMDFLENYEDQLDGKVRVGYETKIKLTKNTDFGKDWFAIPCSENYWKQAESATTDKEFLTAFCNEVKHLCSTQQQVVQKLWWLLMGGNDCYRIIIDDEFPCIHAYNMRGDLSWGKRLTNPKSLKEIKVDAEKDAVRFWFGEGWRLIGYLRDDTMEVTMITKSCALSSHHL